MMLDGRCDITDAGMRTSVTDTEIQIRITDVRIQMKCDQIFRILEPGMTLGKTIFKCCDVNFTLWSLMTHLLGMKIFKKGEDNKLNCLLNCELILATALFL